MQEPVLKVYAAAGVSLPEKATAGSAGRDVRAHLPPDTFIFLKPGNRMTVPTGLFFEIPQGYYISLVPRSGLARNKGLTLLNTPAVIDSDYRGQLMVLMVNLGEEEARIENGERIAQLLLKKCQDFQWEKTDAPEDLSETDRSSGGFGSTGRGLA